MRERGEDDDEDGRECHPEARLHLRRTREPVEKPKPPKKRDVAFRQKRIADIHCARSDSSDSVVKEKFFHVGLSVERSHRSALPP